MVLLSSFELSVFMFLFYDSQFTIFVHLQSYEWKKTRGLSCSKRKFSGLFNFGNYALSGASFISTGIHITLVVTIVTLCQWPEWGDLHFYWVNLTRSLLLHLGVNALNGATSISTFYKKFLTVLRVVCVNALNGATSISTSVESPNFIKDAIIVSMPWMGRPPFLLAWNTQRNSGRYPVSMPWMGRPPFLRVSEIKENVEEKILCQCPEWGDLHFY